MIAWLIVLPLAMAVVLALFRNVAMLTTSLSAATFIASAALLNGAEQDVPLIILGRSLSISATESTALSYCCLLLALVMLYSYRVPQGVLTPSLTLATMGFLVASTVIGNLTLAGLMLEAAIVCAVVLLPGSRQSGAMAAMRTTVVLVLAVVALLAGSWLIEIRANDMAEMISDRAVCVPFVIALATLLACVPFHVWLPSAFRPGQAVPAILFGVALGIVALLLANDVLTQSATIGDSIPIHALLMAAGVLTVVVGSIAAALQRSAMRVAAYAAISDMGFVLIALGGGTSWATNQAILHLGYRGIGITVLAMVSGILEAYAGGDDLAHMRGAVRRTPMTIAALVLGGLSLAGFPPTAAFASRLMIVRGITPPFDRWALWLALASIGPLWGLARLVTAAMMPAPSSASRREPVVPAFLAMILGLALVVLAFVPHALTTFGSHWLWDAIRHITPSLH